MFRFVLQVAFVRRLLQLGVVRIALLTIFIGALVAGGIYTYVVYRAVMERSQPPHVHAHSTP
jgi:hypothetical protein